VRELVFADNGFSDLASELLRADDETAAVLFVNVVGRGEYGERLLVREVCKAPSDAYEQRSPVAIVLSPSFVSWVAKQALGRRQGLIFAHTHPFCQGVPEFSPVDDGGEKSLAEFLLRRFPAVPHGALVLSEGGCRARVLGTDEPMRVVQVGRTLQFLFDPMAFPSTQSVFDRQVRAFGEQGQARLRSLRAGIVGLGGTGSIVAEQLAHLGIGSFLLIDPDVVEESNLNRLVGASQNDVGKPKVEVAARHIESIRPDIQTETVNGSVLQASTARRLAEVDFFFCCTDSHGSRAVLSQVAFQYLVPCIDTGVSISSKDGRVTHITGRVQLLAPGLGCLTCAGLLDSDAVRRDLMTEYERQADQYFIGAHEPQPAVISLNGTVVSLAVTMFLAAVTHIPGEARYQLYNGIKGTIRAVAHTPDPSCIVCSPTGALARGDDWPLPARQT
jgi:molybdopterin-synthase adenylyltransferase